MTWINEPCPFLPEIDRAYSAVDMKPFGKDRGAEFYETALKYAQSHWRLGFPAQAILQCNRALSTPMDGDEPIFGTLPLPYQALGWLILQRREEQFLGNPRRHWQHLATRMVEPHKELRTWRAWACWYLAKTVLPETEFPADHEQIRTESIVEPTSEQIFDHLGRLSPADDLAAWQHALKWAREQVEVTAPTPAAARIRRIGREELSTVIALGREIWNQHYPGIISQAQIDYMLSVWYQQDAMEREMQQRGAVYALIEVADQGAVGYIGFEQEAGSRVLFLSKLYLKQQTRGMGLGRLALDWVMQQASDRDCDGVRLRVNRQNAVAIRSYLRAGFQFLEDLCTDIGSGFVMDDYVMEKPLR